MKLPNFFQKRIYEKGIQSRSDINASSYHIILIKNKTTAIVYHIAINKINLEKLNRLAGNREIIPDHEKIFYLEGNHVSAIQNYLSSIAEGEIINL